MMLDPEKAGALLRHHFDTVTPEEFIANVRRSSPEFAQELWGDRSAAEILAERAVPARAQDDLEPAGLTTIAERRPIVPRRQGMRGFFSSVGRSVLKIFS